MAAPRSVLVVGAGILGLAVAWQLAEQGHQVTVVDPAAAGGGEGSGSRAALGLLMAQVFHRSSGRAWRLRQQSHQLWRQWLATLAERAHAVAYRPGLLLLAAEPRDLHLQARILADRQPMGMPMRQLAASELQALVPQLPGAPLGGLFSPQDGQVDPVQLMAALLQEARAAGAVCLADRAVEIRRGQRWRLELAGGDRLAAHWLVLCLGLATAPLLAGLGHGLELEPVLGQALELELGGDPGWSWPGAVVWRGMNLVPRPDLGGSGGRLWLGATLEPGLVAHEEALNRLRSLEGAAPAWLRQAAVVRQWQGWRCKPANQPAPVLAEPEPGLLVLTGHYRNGVLLAPASAAWACERVGGASPAPKRSPAVLPSERMETEPGSDAPQRPPHRIV
jgi:glycine/D-amino acid oxidase-like deaminating enzyme